MNEKNIADTSVILDAVVQFTYTHKLDIEDVFFQTKLTLKDGFTYTKEPIMELPEALREGDPKLNYTAYYKFSSDNLIVKISPNMLSFAIAGFYPGWSNFKEQIVSKYNDLAMGRELNNISIRYIDFFEDVNIFEHTSLKVETPEAIVPQAFEEKKRHYFCEFASVHDTNVKLQIVNSMTIKTAIDTQQNGSLIDTDVHSQDIIDYQQTLDAIHSVAKDTYFGLLKDKI